MTLWFTAVLAIALTTAGILVYTQLNRELTDEVDSSIASKAQDTALAVRLVNDRIVLPTRIQVPESQFVAPTLYTEVRDLNWSVVWRSDTLQSSDLPVAPSTRTIAQRGVPVVETVIQADQRVRLYTAPVLIRDQTVGYVQVGRNLADIDVALRQLRTWLLTSSVLVVGIAAIGGYLLSRAALRPIDNISSAARAIGQAQRLDRRLPQTGTSDEVGRLAATFNEMLDRLEAVFLAQRRFIADASHELRTPLTTIQGNVQFIRRDPGLPAAARDDALADVSDAASRMGRLVDGLLALARADSGRHLDREPVALRPILERAFHEAGNLPRAIELNLELALNRLEPGARVNGDSDRLRQLLVILLENAVKYSRPGGTVRLVAFTEANAHLIAVADNGPGVAPEDVPHVFERFYRSSRTRSEDGSGLGLAIAQWIVEEHHGDISLETAIYRGSTFRVRLPALEPAPLLPVG
jgi:signal transduction histidine kinase